MAHSFAKYPALLSQDNSPNGITKKCLIYQVVVFELILFNLQSKETAKGRSFVSCEEPDIIAQLVGSIVAGGVLYLIASGNKEFDINTGGFALNGYGEHSPNGYSMTAGFVCGKAFKVAIIG